MGAAGQVIKLVWRIVKKHAPKILAGGAICTELLAMWFMHKEAPIVRDKLDALPQGASLFDKLKTAAPVYIPALAMILASSGCIIGGTIVGGRREAQLVELASASAATLANYQKKAVEVLGPEKAQEIQDQVAQKLIEEKPPTDMNIYSTGRGDQLFFEPLTARYFTSAKSDIERAVNRINRRLISEMWVTTNEWFEEIGLEEAGLGESNGWNIDHPIELYYSPQAAPDDRTCWVIGYRDRPIIEKRR